MIAWVEMACCTHHAHRRGAETSQRCLWWSDCTLLAKPDPYIRRHHHQRRCRLPLLTFPLLA